MMTAADSYGQVLFELGISREAILETRELLMGCDELRKILSNPAVRQEEKHRVIDRLFPQEIGNFLKVLCDNGRMDELQMVRRAYEKCYLNSQNRLTAKLFYAKEPDEEQLSAIKAMIEKKYKKVGIELVLRHDPKLLGGFVLRIGMDEYDRSIKGRLADIYKKLAWG